jgi:sugar-specific transcriptional regulator TrmB
MQDLQELLLNLFESLDSEVKEIVSEVYALEKEYIILHQSAYGINEKIKDIIDRHARFLIAHEVQDEN